MKFFFILAGVVLVAGCQLIPNRNTFRQTDGAVPLDGGVTWNFNGTAWQTSGTPPTCPDPVNLQPPADISIATSILYPGQVRGEYKPHGGFRFDGVANDAVTVTAPADANVVAGSRYLVDGEVQYLFDFIMPCGIMYRLGHLRVLSAEFQALADQFPAAQEMDSRTTWIETPTTVKAGDVIATSVGITSNQNTFFDFGVYDLRHKNGISADPTWATAHTDDPELAPYAVCWLDWLTPEAAAVVKSLPGGDAAAGKQSDYCDNGNLK